MYAIAKNIAHLSRTCFLRGKERIDKGETGDKLSSSEDKLFLNRWITAHRHHISRKNTSILNQAQLSLTKTLKLRQCFGRSVDRSSSAQIPGGWFYIMFNVESVSTISVLTS